MENNANNGNQTIKINNTENNEYKWQKLNYFNKLKVKNYVLTFVYKWNLCKHIDLHIICSKFKCNSRSYGTA